MLIAYVGKKEARADTIAGTGIVWFGHGDTHDVPDEAAVKLLRHPDIWANVEPVVAEAVATGDTPPPANPASSAPNFDGMTDEQVRAWALERNIKPHHKKAGEALRAAVWEALKD
jgi:hypothetical protein